jgi:hypothetical protein
VPLGPDLPDRGVPGDSHLGALTLRTGYDRFGRLSASTLAIDDPATVALPVRPVDPPKPPVLDADRPPRPDDDRPRGRRGGARRRRPTDVDVTGPRLQGAAAPDIDDDWHPERHGRRNA